MGNKFGAFFAGGVIGAVAALLCAPRSGRETRALVTDKVNVAWDEAQQLSSQASVGAQQAYQEASAKGQEVAQNVAAKSQELYGQAQTRVQEAAENIKPVFSEKNDELREKIEAARQRIAAQVVKNAEASHDAVSDQIPVAADEVEAGQPVASADVPVSAPAVESATTPAPEQGTQN